MQLCFHCLTFASIYGSSPVNLSFPWVVFGVSRCLLIYLFEVAFGWKFWNLWDSSLFKTFWSKLVWVSLDVVRLLVSLQYSYRHVLLGNLLGLELTQQIVLKFWGYNLLGRFPKSQEEWWISLTQAQKVWDTDKLSKPLYSWGGQQLANCSKLWCGPSLVCWSAGLRPEEILVNDSWIFTPLDFFYLVL